MINFSLFKSIVENINIYLNLSWGKIYPISLQERGDLGNTATGYLSAAGSNYIASNKVDITAVDLTSL